MQRLGLEPRTVAGNQKPMADRIAQHPMPLAQWDSAQRSSAGSAAKGVESRRDGAAELPHPSPSTSARLFPYY